MLEGCGEEGVGDHDGEEPDGDAHALGHAGAPPPAGRFNLQQKKKKTERGGDK